MASGTEPARQSRWRLPVQGFGGKIAKIAGASLIGQGIVLASMPVAARLYTPEAFGLQAVYVSILATLSVMACLRFDLAVSLPRDDGEAAHLLAASLLSTALVTLCVLIACLAVANHLLALMHAEGLKPYLLWILPIGVCGTGAYQALSAWATRRRDYRALARTRIHQGVAQAATQIAFGFLPFGPLGLLLGADVGRMSGIRVLARSGDGLPALKGFSWDRLWSAIARYKNFPLISAGSAVINALGLYLPVVLFNAEFGPASSGQFSLAQRVIGLPTILIGQAVAQVYLAEGTALLREKPEGLRALARHTMLRLLGLAILPVLALAAGGPWLFRIVFGQPWTEAGNLARILAPLFLLQFAAFPVSQTLIILEKQKLQLAWDVSRLAFASMAIVIPSRLGLGMEGTAASFALALGLLYMAMLMMILRETRPERMGPHA